MPATSSPARRSPGTSPSPDRKAFVAAGLVLGVVILLGVVIVAATSDPGPRRDTQGQLTEDRGAKPHIIPRPGEGQAPENPGDRGGSAQLALFGVMAIAIGGIGFMALRGGRRARTGREAWKAAARSGGEGAPPAEASPAEASPPT